MIDANTIEGMEQSPPNVTLEANVVWDNLERILSPNYELNGEKLKKPENAPKLETKNMLDYFDEPFSPTNVEKICSSMLKKSVKSPKQLIFDEKSEEDNEWKWPSFSGMEPVVIQNGVTSVTMTEPEETFDYSPPSHSPTDKMSGENICLPSSTSLEVDDKNNRRSRPPS